MTCVYPVAIAKAEGAINEDVDGNRFLDWVGGVGVLNIGHRHPKVVEAVKQHENDYFHAMINILTSEKYIALAEKMNDIVPVKGLKKRTFFANSGAEAIENGVKVARAYTKRPNVIGFSGAFHGRTLLTTHMTAKKANSVGLGPFPDGIFRVDYPNFYRKPAYYTDEEAVVYYIERIKRAFDELTPASQVAAIVFEPVQGEGGFIPAPIEWVKAVRQICDENGIMMMTDEVKTGFGRTGKLFASSYYEDAGCAPDILCTAKSIAGGFPLSAIVARDEIVKGIGGGLIGGPFGGNSVSCAAALATIQVIEDENLCERSLELGVAYTARV
ncbi:MAG: aminotransferase class III-fold pyridoxal phosphate-dependent enzyme [Trichococcus sp.]